MVGCLFVFFSISLLHQQLNRCGSLSARSREYQVTECVLDQQRSVGFLSFADEHFNDAIRKKNFIYCIQSIIGHSRTHYTEKTIFFIFFFKVQLAVINVIWSCDIDQSELID